MGFWDKVKGFFKRDKNEECNCKDGKCEITNTDKKAK